ncbi:hypothetical protein AGLY_014478 [Aphis glycines]|uniref:Uncharacterized protein n=1 Tax=Aphis glycines TaxID=307491 RepID=A0A6G0T4E3_APHGL|nr:hypothetical protein AGLY_014478 [Aphis glycines]
MGDYERLRLLRSKYSVLCYLNNSIILLKYTIKLQGIQNILTKNLEIKIFMSAFLCFWCVLFEKIITIFVYTYSFLTNKRLNYFLYTYLIIYVNFKKIVCFTLFFISEKVEMLYDNNVKKQRIVLRAKSSGLMNPILVKWNFILKVDFYLGLKEEIDVSSHVNKSGEFTNPCIPYSIVTLLKIIIKMVNLKSFNFTSIGI